MSIHDTVKTMPNVLDLEFWFALNKIYLISVHQSTSTVRDGM